MKYDPFLSDLAEQEIAYRAAGKYESAVQVQRLAEATASSPDPDRCPPIYTWLDRGTDRIPMCYLCADGVLRVVMPNGLFWAVTPDVAAYMIEVLGIFMNDPQSAWTISGWKA